MGDTTKLGPLARTDLWAGVKGLLERLMTHLVVGSAGEDPCRSLLGRLGVGLASQVPALSAWEAVLIPWEAWRALCLAECLGFWLPYLVTWLPAWFVGLFPAQEEFSPAGKDAKLLPSPGGRRAPACLLPSLGGRRAPAWEAWDAAKLVPSPKGRWVPGWEVTCLPSWELPAWDELPPSPGGRWVPACLPNWVACAAKLLPSPEGRRVLGWGVTAWEAWLPAWDKLPPSPEGRWAPAWERLPLSPRGRWAPALLPAWDKLPPSPEGRWVPAWERLPPSLRGRWVPAWDKLPPSPGRRWAPACLPVWEAKFSGELVIFPSFLLSKLLN